MILKGVRRQKPYIGVCYANDPKKGEYTHSRLRLIYQSLFEVISNDKNSKESCIPQKMPWPVGAATDSTITFSPLERCLPEVLVLYRLRLLEVSLGFQVHQFGMQFLCSCQPVFQLPVKRGQGNSGVQMECKRVQQECDNVHNGVGQNVT